MSPTPPPDENDAARVAALHRLRVLDTPAEAAFDDVVEMAAEACDAPAALVSLVDRDRQWFKARRGVDAEQMPRDLSFCTHAIAQEDLTRPFVVEDASLDERFRANPLVTGEHHVRFYSGVPLVTAGGHAVGTLCVIDRVPRTLSPRQADLLRVLARGVTAQLELRREVADLRGSQELLLESETRFRRIAANVPGMLYQFVLRADGTTFFPYVSEGCRSIYGCDPAEAMARPALLVDAIHPDDREWFFASVAESAATLRPWRWEGRFRMPGGEVKWVAGASQPRRLEGGDTMWDGLVTDVTPVREARAAAEAATTVAEAASRAKSEFLANMSHELRTPLNGVIGMTDLLLTTPLDARQERYARIAKGSSDTLLALINDILDISKIEAGKLELESRDLDLAATVEDTVTLLAKGAADQGTELVCRVDPRVPAVVLGDAGRLAQVLTNLASNAIKFTAGGEVVVDAELVEVGPGGAVTCRFRVTDTGTGIPADRLGGLFTSFSQGDPSTTRRYGGTGLGLAISKRLAELMGGEIGVSSEVGRGSTFWFTARFDPSPTAGAATVPVGLRGYRVLAVDDNAASVEALVAHLRAWGVRATWATSGERALELLAEAAAAGEPTDAVLVDLAMPGMSGCGLADAVRARGDVGRPRLVLMNGIDVPVDAIDLADRGFCGSLAKPVRQSLLFDALVEALAADPTGRRARRPIAPGVPAGGDAPPAADGRVLLAEDNAVNQIVATEVLAGAGYACDVVANGRDAVAAARSGRYAVVLMDCQMPEMDGLDATAAIRAEEAGAGGGRLPIVALTANAVKGDRDRCLAAGMDDYLSKPLDPGLLVATIRRLVAGRPAAVPDGLPGHAALQEDAAPQAGGGRGAEVDRGALLERCMGNPDLVRRVAAMFEGEARAAVERVGAAARAGDVAGLAREAHSLKGAAANLSAGPVHAAAGALEAACGAGDPAAVAPAVDALAAALGRCLDDLRDLTAAPVPPPQRSPLRAA